MSEKINAGAKILDGLRDALSGNFAAVMIEGQRWIRAPAWQPIDSAPKDGTVIWACDPSRGYESKVVWTSPEWMCVDWRGFGMDMGFYPTHWMHLPKPPVTA